MSLQGKDIKELPRIQSSEDLLQIFNSIDKLQPVKNEKLENRKYYLVQILACVLFPQQYMPLLLTSIEEESDIGKDYFCAILNNESFKGKIDELSPELFKQMYIWLNIDFPENERPEYTGAGFITTTHQIYK